MITRRKLLAGGAILAAGAGGFSIWQRGLRYPRLTFEPADLAQQHSANNLQMTWRDLILNQKESSASAWVLRAIAPEPKLTLLFEHGATINLAIDNIAPDAVLHIAGKDIQQLDEKQDGLRRVISIQSNRPQRIELDWRVDWQDGFDFALLGDMGGGTELAWALQRAHQLNARFFLLLGDFHYTDGEYDSAIAHFKNAPLPVYVTIGNHDFNDSGLIYQQYLDEIGPFNNAFSVAGVRFINVDSALSFFPVSRGHRGDFLRQLWLDSQQQSQPYNDQVVFTHRPLQDPRPNDDHHITGIGEREWLSRSLSAIGARNYFNGHVHHSGEQDFEGLHQYTVGEGLGFADILLQRQVSQLLIGRVEAGKPVSYQWQPLNMPWSAHQSPTHERYLLEQNYPQQLAWYRQLRAG